MAVPPHLRISFTGTLGTNVPAPEIFSFGVNAGFQIGSGGSEQKAALETLAADLGNSMAGLFQQCSTPAKITRVRVASIGIDNKVRRDANGAFVQGDSTLAIPGGDPGVPLPFQCALVVSLRTLFDGPTGRGRFYLPLPAVTVNGADGLITETRRDAIAASSVTALNSMNTKLEAFAPGLRIAVISAGSVTKSLPPAFHKVNKVGVGKVVDTLRTRRNNLSEVMEYSALNA
jgi:hypothetical protein